MANDLLKISGLWTNKDKNGNEYFSGSFGYGTKILIMKNTYKEKENDPDYNFFIAPKAEKTGAKESGINDVDVPF